MTRFLLALIAVITFTALPAMAQTLAYVGATFDPSLNPKTSGSVGILKPVLDSHTYWYSGFEIRGATGQVPIIIPKTGLARLLGCQGRLCLYADGQAGGAVGADASSGALSGGGFGTVKLTSRYSILLAGHALKAPAAGDLKAVVGAALLITP